MRRFHSVLLATISLTLPLSAAAPAMAQVSVDPNALNAIGNPELPSPPPAARQHPTHYARPAHKTTHHHAGQANPSKPPEMPTPAKASAAPAPVAATTGPTEQQKGLGPSFSTLPTLPGAVPPLPAKPAALPPPKTAQPKAAQPMAPAAASANPPGASLALPSAAPPAPPTVQPSAPPQAAQASATSVPAKAENTALPSGADRMILPYSGQETALPAAESAMLTGFIQRYGPETQYSVQAFASVPAGDDDPSTPRRIALDRARAIQSVLVTAGAKPGHIRLIARGNAGGTPPDRVEVVAIPPVPGHTPPSSAP